MTQRRLRLPWRLNPLVLKELRGTLRTRRFFWAYFGTLLALGIGFFLACVAQAVGGDENPEQTGRLLFELCVWSMAGAMVVILPAFSCTALASEREQKSFDLLVTTRLTPWQIVWGKFSAAMLYAVLFLLGSLPLVQIAFLFGGVSPLEVAVAFGALLALAVTVTATSLGLSAPFKGTRWPTALAYAVAFLGFAPGVIAFGSARMMVRHGWGGYGAYASLWLIEIPAAIAISLTAFFLILAVRSVKPASDNRTTGLRLFFPVFALLASGLFWHAIWLENPQSWNPFTQVQGVGLALASAFLFALPWILLFSCEAPLASRRVEAQVRRWARFPLARLLAPGSARGAAFSALVSAVLILGTALVSRRAFPAVDGAFMLGGVALALSLVLFLCGAGFCLSTRVRPGTARALLFMWLGLACSVPVCVQALRPDQVLATPQGRQVQVRGWEQPPPLWTLPFLSPSMAGASWLKSLDKAGPAWSQWGRKGGLPLHTQAMLLFGTGGLLMALWGERRRRRQATAGRTP
jgi:ABC-type transport system involved in multi-copper enzyme maturation permease subunit